MRRHRFIIPGIVLKEDTVGIRDPYLAKQLRSVLRIRTGDEIVVSDGSGAEAVAVVEEYRGDVVMLAIRAPQEVDAEPARRATVYAAITKRDTFEWACQKATECGVARIVPVVTERTVKPNVNLVRLRAIAKEAAEQCGRASVPEIGQIEEFADVVTSITGQRLIASTMSGPDLASLPLEEEVAILVGPEGGFSDREIADAEHNGWTQVSLGKRILRAETAVTVASYLAAR